MNIRNSDCKQMHFSLILYYGMKQRNFEFLFHRRNLVEKAFISVFNIQRKITRHY